MMNDNDPELTRIARAAKDGNGYAANELARRLDRLARSRLADNPDRDDIAQEAHVEFLRSWDETRASAHFYYLRYCLRKVASRYAASASKRQRFLEGRAVTAEIQPEVVGTRDGFADSDLMHRLYSETRSPILRDSERELIGYRLKHPDWSAKHLSTAAGVTEGSLSILMTKKIPLELMRLWANENGSLFDEVLPKLIQQIGRWQKEGDHTLAGIGTTILLSGFDQNKTRHSPFCRDPRGSLIYPELLFLRGQIALAEQDLPFADAMLARLEEVVRAPEMPERKHWIQRTMMAQGRRHTAEFRYDLAARNYEELVSVVPKEIWKKDPVFLHSRAVAHRGVADFKRAESLMRTGLDVYTSQDQVIAAIHTRSRLARVLIEKGEREERPEALTRAETILYGLETDLPRLKEANPLGYVQVLIHKLQLHGALGRNPESVRPEVLEAERLIDRGGLAHEYVELENVFDRYQFGDVYKDSLRLAYSPKRPRFGMKLVRLLKRKFEKHRSK